MRKKITLLGGDMKKRLRGDIEHGRADFKNWQEQNPSKTFKDYFAETIERKLLKGKAHRSLGSNLKDKQFGESREIS